MDAGVIRIGETVHQLGHHGVDIAGDNELMDSLPPLLEQRMSFA